MTDGRTWSLERHPDPQAMPHTPRPMTPQRPRHSARRGTALATMLLAGLAVFLASGPARASGDPDGNARDWTLCDQAISAAETRHGLPDGLLAAIALAESGRWSKERSARTAWPWTIYAEGRGRYLPSKAAALAEIRSLRAKGVRNIDIGCMQVNFHFHGEQFDNITQMIDPAYNADYAARFLKDLQGETATWTEAVGFYHSRTPSNSKPYRNRVLDFWLERNGHAPTGSASGKRTPAITTAAEDAAQRQGPAADETQLAAADPAPEDASPGAITPQPAARVHMPSAARGATLGPVTSSTRGVYRAPSGQVLRMMRPSGSIGLN
ncbi:transglycosylase SLT domain-containing protein [Tistrella mobilis]|uniref:transglycosylase SLT domain-containing protein n=1 Tax=Tistrella mobilis TaxID=171437 RepID=UPI0035568536